MINSCGDNQNSKKMNNISNKEKAVALLKAIETGASEPIGYVNAANYKQHNLSVEDGLDGFGRALAGLATSLCAIPTTTSSDQRLVSTSSVLRMAKSWSIGII